MAHLGLIRDAPHVCPFITLKDSCQGHELGIAVEPPRILAPGGRFPHWAAVKKVLKMTKMCIRHDRKE